MKILVLNGPNINMLGIREPGIYGKSTFSDLLQLLEDTAKRLNIDVEQYQSNHEGDLVDKIQAAYGNTNAIVINPAAYTHTSIAYNQQGFSMWQYSWSNIKNGSSYIYNGVYRSGTTPVYALDLDVCYKDNPTIMKTYGYNNCGTDEKANLGKTITSAKEVRYSDYTQNELDTLRSAYDTAVSVYNSASSSQSDYKTARENLEKEGKGRGQETRGRRSRAAREPAGRRTKSAQGPGRNGREQGGVVFL